MVARSERGSLTLLIGIALATGIIFISQLDPRATTVEAWSPSLSPSRKFHQSKFRFTEYSYHHHQSSSSLRPTLSPTAPFSSAASLTATSENAEQIDATMNCADKTLEVFDGSSILLTGATGGLGKALASKLILCNPKHLVLSGRNAAALDQLKADLSSTSSSSSATTTIHTITCDLSDPTDVEKMGKKALDACQGTINVLINNGGVSSRSNFVDTTIDVDQKVMQINFLAGAALSKIVTPGMIQQPPQSTAKILWISSVQGKVGIPSRTSYAASKFAVQGYCESLRAELSASHVDVHVASPGYIRTNLSLNAVTGDGSSYGKMDDTTANGADPHDVAVEILDKVAAGNADFIVASSTSAIAAIWLRLLCPGVLRSLLDKRFVKAEKAKKSKTD